MSSNAVGTLASSLVLANLIVFGLVIMGALLYPKSGRNEIREGCATWIGLFVILVAVLLVWGLFNPD